MKLVVQIPCRDEADTLQAVIAAIPSAIDAVDQIEVLVLDDGSRDGSARIAALAGARVLSSPKPVGLARTFAAGLQEALRHDADLIANLDGDGQYDAAELPRLLAPILQGEADLVVGDRSPATLRHFSWRKRLLQRLGGVVVRLASGVAVADPVSGYRVLTRSAASRLEIRGPYTYTIEMLVQVRGLALTAPQRPDHGTTDASSVPIDEERRRLSLARRRNGRPRDAATSAGDGGDVWIGSWRADPGAPQRVNTEHHVHWPHGRAQEPDPPSRARRRSASPAGGAADSRRSACTTPA